MRAKDAVRALIPCTVQTSVLIRACDAFIQQCPDKAAGADLTLTHQLPIVPQPCAGAAVIESMQKLCRHIDVWPAQTLLNFRVLFVVRRVDLIEQLPRVKNSALLRVPLGKLP